MSGSFIKQYDTVMYEATPQQMWGVQTLNSQQTPNSSPSRANYGVSFVSILEKIDHIMMKLNWPTLYVHDSKLLIQT